MERKLLAVVLGLAVVSCSASLKSVVGGGGDNTSSKAKQAASDDSGGDEDAPKPKKKKKASDDDDGGEAAPAPKVGKLESGKAPPWCKGYEPSSTDSNIHWVDSYIEKEGFSEKTIEYMAKAVCDKKDGERQKKLGEWIEKFKSDVGGSEADFVMIASYEMMPQDTRSKLEKEQCAKYKEADEEESSEGKLLRLAMGSVFGCERYPNQDALFYLDKPDVNEVERVAIVNICVPRAPSDGDKISGAFAFCGVDLGKLDRGAFDKDLAGMETNAAGKVNALYAFLDAKGKATALTKKWNALAKKDEDWKKLLAAPQQGWDMWVKEAEANKEAFDAVKAFDAKAGKGSKKSVSGCGDALRKPFLAHLASKKKVKKIDDIQAVATDMVGYPLLVALMRCDAAEGRYLQVAAAEHLFMEKAKPHKGPRFEAYDAAFNALNEIRGDRDKFPLERMYPEPPRTARDVWYKAYEQTFNKIQYDKPATGQIKAVTPKGDVVHLTFKTVHWKEEVPVNCVDTRKISRIRDDGTLEYEQRCKYEVQAFSSTQEPVDVPKEYAKGLKAGMMIELMIDHKKTPIGMPSGVWKDTAKKKFIGAFGVVAP